jgi:hypothetical protein
MYSLMYAIGFLCLLRSDEILNIKVEHIQLLDEETGEIQLTLPFRKTHQVGGKQLRGVRDFSLNNSQ